MVIRMQPPRRGASRLLTLFAVLPLILATLFFTMHKVTANPITIENSNPGDPTWDWVNPPNDFTTLSGYASPVSVNRGGTVSFYITTTSATYTIDVYRTGWYGGAGARLMTNLGPFNGQQQAVPSPDPNTGMISCARK